MRMKTPLLLDGPMGSLLTERGVSTSGPGWSARALRDAPQEVTAIHRAYVAAGADLHRTNTFRTRPRDIGPDFAELARLAVRLAREAVGLAPLYGVLGPLGDCYDSAAAPAEAAAREAHAALAEILVSAGVDGLLCETFPTGAEACAAVAATVGLGVPVAVSLTGGPSAELFHPHELAKAAEACARLGAGLVAVNCIAIERILPFASALRATGVPFGVYANAASWNAPRATPPAFAAQAEALLALEPTWLGVCCGGGPLHVRALRALIASPSVPSS